MMSSPTHTHCTLWAVREASNTHFSGTPEELDLPIDATACIYGTIFARLKTGCSHSPFQIRGFHSHIATCACFCNCDIRKITETNQLHDLLETSNQGVLEWREKWTRHCLCQFCDLFFLNRCVRVGWKFPSPVEFRLLG